MSNAEIREANWPKMKSLLEQQMMLCTSKLEQVQVRSKAAKGRRLPIGRRMLPLPKSWMLQAGGTDMCCAAAACMRMGCPSILQGTALPVCDPLPVAASPRSKLR